MKHKLLYSVKTIPRCSCGRWKYRSRPMLGETPKQFDQRVKLEYTRHTQNKTNRPADFII